MGSAMTHREAYRVYNKGLGKRYFLALTRNEPLCFVQTPLDPEHKVTGLRHLQSMRDAQNGEENSDTTNLPILRLHRTYYHEASELKPILGELQYNLTI